jgi:hypothetical protein
VAAALPAAARGLAEVPGGRADRLDLPPGRRLDDGGKVGKGVGILLGYILGAILTIFIVGIIIAIPLWIWGMVAGYQDAVAWNRAHGIIS